MINKTIEDNFSLETSATAVEKKINVRDPTNNKKLSPVHYAFIYAPQDIINILLNICDKYEPSDETWLNYVKGRLHNDSQYRNIIPFRRLTTDFNLGNNWLAGPSSRSNRSNSF
jgi:hypothetical protein